MIKRVSGFALNSGSLLSKLLECHVTNVVTYDCTIEPFRKGPPKVRRFSGRLREVIGYKNRTEEGLFREKVPTN